MRVPKRPQWTWEGPLCAGARRALYPVMSPIARPRNRGHLGWDVSPVAEPHTGGHAPLIMSALRGRAIGTPSDQNVPSCSRTKGATCAPETARIARPRNKDSTGSVPAERRGCRGQCQHCAAAHHGHRWYGRYILHLRCPFIGETRLCPFVRGEGQLGFAASWDIPIQAAPLGVCDPGRQVSCSAVWSQHCAPRRQRPPRHGPGRPL